MKIVEVKTYPLLASCSSRLRFRRAVVHKRSATLVEVITDEGLVGLGRGVQSRAGAAANLGRDDRACA